MFSVIPETLHFGAFNNARFNEKISEKLSLPKTFIRYEKSSFIWNELFE